MKVTAASILLSLCLAIGYPVIGQYTLNGSASRIDCHCYTLTSDTYNTNGSVWNNNKINLNQSFDFKFDIFLGCSDNPGADGIAFVLQPVSTSIGSQGSGLGYAGVSPAVGVTIDTYQNKSAIPADNDEDPDFDHIAIQLNGDLDHKDSTGQLSINNVAGPVSVIAGSNNIEDCRWHVLTIRWDVLTKTFSAYIDGSLRVSVVRDLVATVFGGDPLVFWGFTGSTGMEKNLQQFCTASKPSFGFLSTQKKCLGEQITFYDSTISFTQVKKYYWDFGDGSPIDSINPNPVHTYVAAGKYTVVQKVLGADGCLDVNTQNLVIGTVPLANFTFNNACVSDSLVKFINTSTASSGTINQWYWDLGDGSFSTSAHPSKIYSTSGLKKIRLTVKSIEGCVSDTVERMLQVYQKPVADFTFSNKQCWNEPVQFNGVSAVSDGSIAGWKWNLDSLIGKPAYIQSPTNNYALPGPHFISLVTESSNGCVSKPIIKTILVSKPVANFKNANICMSAPVALIDSSYNIGQGNISGWWWDLGNGTITTSRSPVTTYNVAGDITIQLVATNALGCNSDTIKKSIYIAPKPVAGFGYSSPPCTNRTIWFSDSSKAGSGAISAWNWIFDNGNSATTQDAATVFTTTGRHLVKLVVKDAFGCFSDTAAIPVPVDPHPAVNFNAADACKNTPVSLMGVSSSEVGIAKWQWNFNDGSVDYTQNTQHVFKTGGNFPVRLFGLSYEGCYSDTVVRQVKIYGTDVFAGNDTVAAPNQPVQLVASGGTNYQWLPATGLSNAFIFNPVAINSTDRSYIVRAFTQMGCESFDTIRIKIYNGPEIYVPKAFSPNGDGLNELLKAIPVGTSQFKKFTVYNRFGQIVFLTTSSNRGWDGWFNGKPQNAGVYIWIAEGVGYTGTPIFRKGTVMLVR